MQELNEPEYIDDDFADAVALIQVRRRLEGRNALGDRVIIGVLRKYVATVDDKKAGGYPLATLLNLVNKRKELRDATNNTLKQSDASQADSTPSKLNTPRHHG
jgi:hypothetical protein